MTLTVAWGNTVQWGTEEAGVWTTRAILDGVPVIIGAGDTIGAIFEVPELQFSGSRVIDGPVVSGVTLKLPVRGIPAQPDEETTVRLWVVPETAADDFGASDMPLARGEVLLGTITFPTPGAIAPTLIDLEATDTTELRAFVTSRSLWEGRVAFVIEYVSGDTFEIINGPSAPMTVNAEQDLFFAGMTGGGDGKLRAVRDGRYGMPAFHTDLVQDGDQPGLYVKSFDVDPEDEEATYRPKPGEGTRTDEIPDF